MKTRNIIKSIIALVSGFSLIGATVMGATAGLQDYPSMFIKNGNFNGVVVVGDTGSADDVVGAIDISTNLQMSNFDSKSIQTSVVLPTSSSVSVSRTNDMLEFNELLSDARDTLTSTDWGVLGDSFVSTKHGRADYEQYLGLGDGKVVYDENRDGKTGNYAYFDDGNTAFEYTINFNNGLTSDLNGNNLDDMEDQQIVMMGTPMSIVDATKSGNYITLSFMGGEVLDTMEEGETRSYILDGKNYEVQLIIVSDQQDTCKFLVNGEITPTLTSGDNYMLDDGTELGVRAVMPNEAQETTGGDIVEFYLGAKKVQFKDNYKSTDYGSVEVNGDTLRYGEVQITASDNTDEVTISSIKYRMEIDAADGGEIYVPEGKGLKEYLSEPESMLFPEWDIRFEGVSDEDTTEVNLKLKGDDSYELDFTNRNGNHFNVPLMDTTGSFKYGDDSNKLWIVEPYDGADKLFLIAEDDYFLFNDLGTEKGDSNVAQLSNVESDSISIYIDGTERLVSYDSTNQTTITIGNKNYKLWVDPTNKKIAFDNNGDGLVNGNEAKIVTENGLIIDLGTQNTTDGSLISPNIKLTTLSKLTDESSADLITSFDVEDAGSQFHLVNFTGISFVEDEDSNERTAKDVYGTEYELSDDNDELKVKFPKTQVEANVELVYGKMASAASTIGDEVPQVISMPPSKLASEIIGDYSKYNIISVGGSCVNSVTAKLMGSDVPLCGADSGLKEGSAIVKLYQNGEKIAMVVAGWEKADTRRAANVIANFDAYKSKIQGNEIEITAGAGNNINVFAPSLN